MGRDERNDLALMGLSLAVAMLAVALILLTAGLVG